MRRAGWVTGLVFLISGCAYTSSEQAQAYRDDAFRQVQLGRYGNARESFQAALQLEPNDVGLIYNVGYCSDRIGDAPAALQYYGRCIQSEPNNETYRYAMASLLLRQGQRSESIRVVQDWLAQQPQRAEAYCLDGWLWHELGDMSCAQSRLQQALALDPQNVRALVELGIIYEELDRPDRSLLLYDQALTIQPDQPDVIARVNRIHARLHPPPQPGT